MVKANKSVIQNQNTAFPCPASLAASRCPASRSRAHSAAAPPTVHSSGMGRTPSHAVMEVREMGKAHTSVTSSVSTIKISRLVRRSLFVSTRRTTNAGTIMAQAPMLNARIKAKASTDRQTRWNTLLFVLWAVTARPSPSKTPIPMHAANGLAYMNMEIIRMPSSTTSRSV